MPTTRLPTVRASERGLNMSGGGGGPCTVRSMLNKFEHVRGIPVQWGPKMNKSGMAGLGSVQGPPSVCEQSDRHGWKHYLPTTSLVYGIKDHSVCES